ncbi:MAG: ferritin-like domain-containing protein [Chloroherpetonaceae bacterium]|nr:ferritin-like domain-containing protein [Chloroherpetonaceae bacterium]
MNRRDFLKNTSLLSLAGGAGAASLLLSSCESSVTSNDKVLETDLAFLTEAVEMEGVAVKTYDAAASSGLITDTSLLSVAVLYRDHHYSHFQELNALRRRLGFASYDINIALPDARVSGLTNQTSVLTLARDLELQAAEAYFRWVTGELNIPEVRRFFANTYPIETAHFIVLKGVLSGDIPGSIDSSQLEFLKRS